MPLPAGKMNGRKAERPCVERLAEYILELDKRPLSPNAERMARLSLLDTLGAGLYSSTQPEAKLFLRASKQLGSGSTPVWGTSERLEAGMAALVNGSLCHLRELDDVHYAILHTGCVCVPAALAAAQLQGADFGTLLRALVNGVEVTARIALGMDYMDHRERGWHGTATCGAFGAAAAAGHVLGLNERQLADAIGIAGSRTGGTWAFSADGAMTKRLHPGLAARDGLLAAYLAQTGVTGPHSVLEAEDGGFYRLFSQEWDVERALASSSRLEVENVEFKWFASCKSVHSPIAASLKIHERTPARKPEEVKHVEVEVNRSALSMAGHYYEKESVVSAQISIPYGVALGLTGHLGLAEDYTFEQLADPVLYALSGRVEVVESEEFNALRAEKHLSGARVTVYWTDGTSDTETVTLPKGSIADPLTEEDVIHKFRPLAARALGEGAAEQLLELVLQAPADTSTAVLAGLLTPGD